MCYSNDNPGAGDGDNSTIDSSGPSLEVDSDDRDSALGDNQSTYTMSATSSVYNFKYENGRRYHAYAEGKYPIPNDEVEKDRLDLQHQAFRLTIDGKLYIAPIPKDVQDVLDIGCGTGIWTIEFADDHPSANVIGTDLSPIQPTSVPPNCSFLIDDCDQDWIFHNKFDYIHTRAMVAAIKDWDRLFEQAYANLKPGGYLECQEIAFPMLNMDPSLNAENSPVLRWSALCGEAFAKTGLDAFATGNLAPKLRAAGFVDIRAKNYKWPVGRWAKGAKMKLLGYYVYEDVMDWLPSSAMGLFTRVLKWTREEVELFLVDCRRELKQKRGFYANTYFWVARKPENAASSSFDQDFVRDDESLEVDEGSQASAGAEDAPAESQDTATAGATATIPSPGASSGTLAEHTADLSIASPTQGASPSPPPTASSESRKSMLSMEEMLNPAAPSTSATTVESAQPAQPEGSGVDEVTVTPMQSGHAMVASVIEKAKEVEASEAEPSSEPKTEVQPPVKEGEKKDEEPTT